MNSANTLRGGAARNVVARLVVRLGAGFIGVGVQGVRELPGQKSTEAGARLSRETLEAVCRREPDALAALFEHCFFLFPAWQFASLPVAAVAAWVLIQVFQVPSWQIHAGLFPGPSD